MAIANPVDQTLALVKDADKFKARLAELGKAEKAAQDAAKKSNAQVRENFKKIDADNKAAQKDLADARTKADQAQKSVDGDRAQLETERGKFQRALKKFEKDKEKLAEEREVLQIEKEAIAAEKDKLASKIKTFENAVLNACSAVTG